MDDIFAYYGHWGEPRYPLAARVWGHRLREGQHWMEYLLEFLNVLAGFDYRLGRGLDRKRGDNPEGYIRLPRMGLRRFVFYDEREKTRDIFDDFARNLLLNELKKVVGNGSNQEKAIACVRDLFRSLSAVEDSRSWFAKSLLPINHNLLFWEGEKDTPKRRPVPTLNLPLQMYDAHISLTGRNFFARGGEVYYLMLSAGTEEFLARREVITQKLEALLKENNQDLGIIANAIDQAWYRKDNYESGSGAEHTPSKLGRYPLGWIPEPNCSMYRIIAEDTATFLQSDLEPFECLALLACLISFHLVLYIYHRAQPNSAEGQHGATCYSSCRPLLLVHMAEGESGSAIREISERLFRQQESFQEQKARSFIETSIRACAAELPRDTNFAVNLVSDTKAFFSMEKKNSTKIMQLQAQYSRKGIDEETFLREYAEALWRIAEGEFDKNFLGVHRKLTKAAGFVAPKKGPGGRFVLGDDLLKALVLANVHQNMPIPFDDFLRQLYERYGILVGPQEARFSSLINTETINTDYYDLNRRALLEKMKSAGLVTQYSDATALVHG